MSAGLKSPKRSPIGIIEMKPDPLADAPADANERKARAPVLVYPQETLPEPPMALYAKARETLRLVDSLTVPPRDGGTIQVKAGQFFRVVCPEGPQVGDLNLWNAHDLSERFFSGKTRALHGTHVGRGDQLWSNLPFLRPMATITWDTLDWYGWDADGGGVHDVIGTRCDPYTNAVLGHDPYHHCCHSNLTRALSAGADLSPGEAEILVHDVLNVFMCTGFERGTGRYFMKASPVRQGDYLELFAEIDLLIGLSTCPGGDCGDKHSSDVARCWPLRIDVFEPDPAALGDWRPSEPAPYDRSHGIRA